MEGNTSFITQRILRYLKSHSRQALLITGPWGSGKTHFVKNEVIENEKISSLRTVVNISLFGLQSTEEIDFGVYMESEGRALPARMGLKMFNLLKDVAGEAFSFTKPLLKGVGEGKNLKYSELLIIIDDLERKGDNLSVEEFASYVNNIVEHREGKVIVIANESKINGKFWERYIEFKEKIIGESVAFLPNIEASIDSIINSFGDAYPQDYVQEIIESKPVILNHLKSAEGPNFRVLISSIDNFFEIYQISKPLFLEVGSLHAHESQIWRSSFCFFLALSIAVSDKRISEEDRIDLKTGKNYTSKEYWSGQVEESKYEKNAWKYFITPYFSNPELPQYYFLESIFDNILVHGFEVDKFFSEWIKKFPDTQDLPESVKIYNYFDWGTWRNAGYNQDVEIQANLKKLIQFAKRGEYQFLQYPTIASRIDLHGFCSLKKQKSLIKTLIRSLPVLPPTSVTEMFVHQFQRSFIMIEGHQDKFPITMAVRQAMDDAIQAASRKGKIAKEKHGLNLFFENINQLLYFSSLHESDPEYLALRKLPPVHKVTAWIPKIGFDERMKVFDFFKNRWNHNKNGILDHEIDYIKAFHSSLKNRRFLKTIGPNTNITNEFLEGLSALINSYESSIGSNE